MARYNHAQVEKKWQEFWEKNPINPKDDKKEKYYCLDMFPYPSGSGLHVGHWRGYVISDAWSRYQLIKGKYVIHPMGWDAFGLPAENYAIKMGIHPSITTKKNVENIKRQLQQINAIYDWDMELNTTDPDYFKWTQWIFVKMFEKGLAYEKEFPINWCPSCKTGLANEEVVDGKCERCGTAVTKKNLRQWMLKITAYADRLLDDLDTLDWPVLRCRGGFQAGELRREDYRLYHKTGYALRRDFPRFGSGASSGKKDYNSGEASRGRGIYSKSGKQVQCGQNGRYG